MYIVETMTNADEIFCILLGQNIVAFMIFAS